jgi:hypothetical protein
VDNSLGASQRKQLPGAREARDSCHDRVSRLPLDVRPAREFGAWSAAAPGVSSSQLRQPRSRRVGGDRQTMGKPSPWPRASAGLHQSGLQHVQATHIQPVNFARNATTRVSVRAPTSLARDLTPDDLVGCAPFGAPIGRKFVNHPQAASAVLVLCRRAQHGATTSLVFHLDAYPVGIRIDGHAIVPRAWTTALVTSSLPNSSATSMIDASTPVVGQDVACEDASFTNAGGPAQELDHPDHRFPHPEHGSVTRASHTQRGCSKEARPFGSPI